MKGQLIFSGNWMVDGNIFKGVMSVVNRGEFRYVVNDPVQSSLEIQEAQSKLELALSRLETVIKTKSVSDYISVNTDDQLTAAKEEINELKKTNEAVLIRLDTAINRVKDILGS